MPWLTIRPEYQEIITSFITKYKIEDIPRLVQINERFVNIRSDCLDIVLNSPFEAHEIFLKSLKESNLIIKQIS